MAITIAVCNQKGGVGKSTTAVNVGSYIALSGRRTLLIDLDAQGNATTTCGIQRKSVDKDLYSVLVEGVPIGGAIQKTLVDRLEILPSSLDLAGAESRLAGSPDRETILKQMVEPIREQYDYLLLDCPPSLGLMTVNALVVADTTIIPVQCEYLSLEGLNSLLQAIDLIKHRMNPALQVGGIVLTMTDFRANLTKEVANEVKRFFKDLVFETSIPRNVRLAESPSFGKPICLYDPHSTGALAYRNLAQEVIAKVGVVRNDQAIGQRA